MATTLSNRGKHGMTQSAKFSFKDNWLLILISLLVVGLIIQRFNFYATHEKVADDPDFIITPEARENRFFISQKLLEKQQKNIYATKGEAGYNEVKKIWKQSPQEAQKQAVLLYHITKNQQPDIDNIIKWVEKGGHLITFSQDTLETDPSDNDIKRYEFNENLLLVKLGIVNNHFYKYDSKFTQPEDNESDNEKQSISVSLEEKSLLKLPMKGNGDVLALLQSEDEGHLNTDKFFEKNPQAQPIADYRFIQNYDLDEPFATENIQFASVSNPLTMEQYAEIKKAINKRPNEYLPIDKAMFDVRFGQGRITVFTDKNVFVNPPTYHMEDMYEKYCGTNDDPICKQAEESNKKQIDTPKIPIKTTWQLLNDINSYTSNPNVATLDNYLILNYLLQDRENVWFVSDVKVASLFSLLWKHFKWAVVAFWLFLGMAMLALPKRFGQPRPYKTDSQSNIIGYFEQVGQYLWQSDKAVALVEQNRQRLLEKIIARHPVLTQHNPIEPNLVCQLVAKDMVISPESVAQALYDEWRNESEFLQMSKQFAVINRYY